MVLKVASVYSCFSVMVLNYLAIENLRFTEICLKYSKINVTKGNKSKRHYSNTEIEFKDGSKPFFKLH